jgi:hypothetical protein
LGTKALRGRIRFVGGYGATGGKKGQRSKGTGGIDRGLRGFSQIDTDFIDNWDEHRMQETGDRIQE